MNILETSPNGKLRLRAIGKVKGVVELLCGDKWVWCVWRSTSLDQAKTLFNNQTKYHQ